MAVAKIISSERKHSYLLSSNQRLQNEEIFRAIDYRFSTARMIKADGYSFAKIS